MLGKKYATIRKLSNRNIIEHKFRHALNIIVVPYNIYLCI